MGRIVIKQNGCGKCKHGIDTSLKFHAHVFLNQIFTDHFVVFCLYIYNFL